MDEVEQPDAATRQHRSSESPAIRAAMPDAPTKVHAGCVPVGLEHATKPARVATVATDISVEGASTQYLGKPVEAASTPTCRATCPHRPPSIASRRLCGPAPVTYAAYLSSHEAPALTSKGLPPL